MKAIIVIKEMPRHCGECKYCSKNNTCTINLYSDELKPCDVKHAKDVHSSPSWCPIIPIPSKRESVVNWINEEKKTIKTHEISEYDKGWNDCLTMLEDFYD